MFSIWMFFIQFFIGKLWDDDDSDYVDDDYDQNDYFIYILIFIIIITCNMFLGMEMWKLW